MTTSAISKIDTRSGKLVREIPINAAHVEAMGLEDPLGHHRQEEIGLRVAHTAAGLIKPEIGIAIEAGVTADVNGRLEKSQKRRGGGPRRRAPDRAPPAV